MICIYSQTNTNYDKNGDAVLNPISCTLTMTINGAWQLNLEHPYDSEGKYKIIKEGAVLRVDLECISELSTVRQLFRIYNYSKGMHSVTAIAFPVAMESTYDAPVDNLVIDNMTGAQVFAELQEYTDKYTLYTNVSKTKSASYSNTNINEIIASGGDTSFIKLWGGEILYDNLNYKVLTSLGNSTADFRIKYGRNLMGITYQVDDSGLITRLYPISSDNIRLDVGYVQSDNAGLYPVIHSQFVNAPYSLIEDDATSPSRTAKQTRNSMSAITTSANSTSHSAYATALDSGYQPDYIKSIRASIISAVITQALNGVVSTDLYNLASKTITSAMSWMGNLEQPEWEWQGSYEDGWWYGNSDGYAKNQYVRIGKKWSYFGAEGYWEEPKDDSEEWDWHQPVGSTGKRYGNYRKYFAHDEYVYITMDGTLKSYWFNEEGWYEADESGDSTWDWHGSGTAEDPYWFGEEGASADDERKYAHDCWLFIDGSLYFFDSFGYYTPGTQMSDYQWDWVQSDERWWFGNAEDKEYAATYLVSQWEKINGTWYYFDANGYVVAENTSKANAIAVFTSGMSGLTTVCSAQKTILYELLYDLMEEYCGKLFDQGIDYPMVSVTADMVDLSQTVDYAEFSDLEKVNLGDSVKVVDDEHNISYSNRVVGITYDCIRKYNSVVTLGTAVASVQQIVGNANGTPAVSSGIDTTALEAQLSAKVSDVRYEGSSLVNNGVAILDNVGTEVEANPSGTATVDLTKLRVDDVIYHLAGGGGLEYWTETETDLYNTINVEGLDGDSDYYFDSIVEWTVRNSTHGYPGQFDYKKANAKPALIATNTQYNGLTKNFYLVSVDQDAVEWLYKCSFNTEYIEPQEGDDDGGYIRGVTKGSFTYNNATWYFSKGTANYDYQTASSFWITSDFQNIDATGTDEAVCKLIIDTANGTASHTEIMGISTEDEVLYYGEGDVNNHSNSASITKDGVFTGSDFIDDGESLKTLIDNKQDLLTAGNNIQIENDVISATYSNFVGTDGINDGSNGLVPAPTSSDSNKYLKSDGTWETISGGSSVVANPSGTATDTLNTISIDNVIYEIQGGGGGSSGYSETVLNDGTNTNNVYTLSDSMDNYDLLEIEWSYGNSYYGSVITSVESFKTFENGILVKNTDNILFILQYTSDTSVTRHTMYGSLEIRQIKGLKFGGGSSNSNIVELTQDEYSQITPSADTLYLIYGSDPVLDPNYNYYTYGSNNEIVVRVYHEGESDEEILWFFKGFTKTASDWAVPSDLQSYTPTSGSHTSAGYSTEDSTTQLGWIGWAVDALGRNVIRSWTTDWYYTQSGTYYAVVDTKGDNATLTQYYDPYVYTEETVPVREIYYNSRKYSSGGGYSENVLYTASDLSFSDITVDWSWSDYDQYIFMVHDALPNVQNGDTTIFTKSQIDSFISSGTLQYFYRAGYYAGYTYSNNQITANNHSVMVITQIMGIKFS